MVRRKRHAAILVLKCVIIVFCAVDQQAALGTGMAALPKPAGGVFEEVVGNNVRLVDIQLSESGHASLFPLILAQPDLVASASQGVGGYILVAQGSKNADAPAEPQAVVQETKNADAPAEPQAVMQEIKSTTRLSGSKRRRRKPMMAGVPAGSQAVAQETKEPESAVAQETKEPESQAMAQETKKPKLQAAIKETEEIDTLDNLLAEIQKTKKADIPDKPQAEVKKLQLPETRKKEISKKYVMAPIRWKANLSETIGWENHSQTIESVNQKSHGLVNTQTADIIANTYIMQRYIALLSGRVGVVSSRYIQGSSSGGSNSNFSDRTNTLSGDSTLSLFSQSRFPFTMSLGVASTRDHNNADPMTQDRTRYINLQQTYKPKSMEFLTHVNYEATTLKHIVPAGGGITHSFWSGDYRKFSNEHKFQGDARYNDKTIDSINGTETHANNFTVMDRYLPLNSLLSLYSLASYNSFTSKGGGFNSNSSFLQAQTGASWQPEDEDLPLFVDGRAHLYRSVINGAPSLILGGAVGATYLFPRSITGRVDHMMNSTRDSSGYRSLSTSQKGTLSYLAPATPIWKNASYSWNANVGASNQTGYAPDSSVFSGISHNLSISYPSVLFGRKWQITPVLNQALSTTITRSSGQTISLVNSGSVSLAPPAIILPNKHLLGESARTSGLSTSAKLRVQDALLIGKTTSHTRSITWTISEKSLSQFSGGGLTADISFGAVQSSGGSTSTTLGGVALVGNSTVSYSKSRVFGVRGLEYTASFNLTGQAAGRIEDPQHTSGPRYPWTFEQNLMYKIGMNEVTLRGRISEQYGVKDASLWLQFRAWRTIGNN